MTTADFTMTIDEIMRRYVELDSKYKAVKREQLSREVMLGWLLMQAKPRMRDTYGRFLREYGLNIKTAQRRVKLADKYATPIGGVDEAKLNAAVAAWNAKAHTPQDVIQSGRITLHQAELAAGIRTVRNPDNTGPIGPLAKRNPDTCGPIGPLTQTQPAANATDSVVFGCDPALPSPAEGFIESGTYLPDGTLHINPEDRMTDEEFYGTAQPVGQVVEFKATPVGVPVLTAKAAERRAAQQNQLALASVYQAVEAERAMRAKADQMRFEREAEYIDILNRHAAEWKRFVDGGAA